MVDDPRQTAFNTAAPASERFDAGTELAKSFRALSSELIPAADLAPVIDYIRDQAMVDPSLLKASASNVLQFPGRMRPAPKRGMQSVRIDNQQVMQSGEYYERTSMLDFNSLRQMVDATPILSGIVLTRQRQIRRFCGPSEDGGLGFEIRHRDKKHKKDASDEEAFGLLSRFFQSCGWEFNPRARRRMHRTNFSQLMALLVRDTLTMDSMPIETEMKRNANLGIDGLYAVDGATIRLCTEEGYEGDDQIFAVQVVEGRVCNAYTYDQLIYEPRNPRTDVRIAGYGFGETELLVRVVTGFLNAMTYNIRGFDENSIPRGLLQLTGEYDKKDIQEFKRYWNQMVKGINNSWALPVLVSGDSEGKASFERFGIEFNEMYFSKWMTFLTSIACAIYGMSPEEINFESFAANKSSLSGNDTEQRLASGADKGLRPLMSYFEDLFSDYIVSSFNQDLLFRWVGLDPRDQVQEWEGRKLSNTVNEIRALQGDDPHPDPLIGDAPVNPALIPLYQQKVMPPPEPPEDPGTDFGGPPGQQETMDFGDADAGPSMDDDQGGDDFGSGGGPPPSNDDGGGFGKAFPSIYAVR